MNQSKPSNHPLSPLGSATKTESSHALLPVRIIGNLQRSRTLHKARGKTLCFSLARAGRDGGIDRHIDISVPIQPHYLQLTVPVVRAAPAYDDDSIHSIGRKSCMAMVEGRCVGTAGRVSGETLKKTSVNFSVDVYITVY